MWPMLVEMIINKRLSKRLVAQSSKEMNDNCLLLCSVYPTVVGLFLGIYSIHHVLRLRTIFTKLDLSSQIAYFDIKDLISLIEIAAIEENVQVL